MIETNQLDVAIGHFNAGAYRDALLGFEALWHAERSDLLKALVQLSNALNQLRLGMATSPRFLLERASALLEPYPAAAVGLDLAALRATIAALRAAIPPDAVTGEHHIAWETLPPARLLRCANQTAADGWELAPPADR